MLGKELAVFTPVEEPLVRKPLAPAAAHHTARTEILFFSTQVSTCATRSSESPFMVAAKVSGDRASWLSAGPR